MVNNGSNLGISINGGTPSYHPFLIGIFPHLNHPAIGVPPIYGKTQMMASRKGRRPQNIASSPSNIEIFDLTMKKWDVRDSTILFAGWKSSHGPGSRSLIQWSDMILVWISMLITNQSATRSTAREIPCPKGEDPSSWLCQKPQKSNCSCCIIMASLPQTSISWLLYTQFQTHPNIMW